MAAHSATPSRPRASTGRARAAAAHQRRQPDQGDRGTLARYKAKRDFHLTPEPRGHVEEQRGQHLSYLIQKHAASHLHYDFRLELNGVLLSWAVPKGPSLDPADKRLAMHVENHPLEYGSFEGTIPKGQYGGGAVMLWDRGTWEPIGDPEEGYRKGQLKFELKGKKLHGRWALVKMRGDDRYGKRSTSEPWLLIKDRDDAAARGASARVVETEPNSVVSGRSIDQIAAAADHQWHSNRSVAENVEANASKTKQPAKRARKHAATAGAKATRVTAKPATLSTAAVESASPKPAAGKSTSPRRTSTSRTKSGSEKASVAGVAISHPDKLMFPEAGISKLDLAHYYENVVDWMLPYIKDRPLSLVRCPDGWGGECFYQKHASQSLHASIRRVEVPESDGTATYTAVTSLTSLVAMVQWGVIELHPWGARMPHPERPDQIIFDFDPADDVPWPRIVEAVKGMRGLLEELGLTSFLKTTGGKGLHVVVPIRPTLTWDEAKRFSKAVADIMAKTFPDRFIAVMSKAKRKGLIFIDYLRNGEGATAIAPYGVRSRENAPVSTPIAWKELARDVRFDYFNVKTVQARLARLKNDPWEDFLSTRQSITAAMFRKLGLDAPARKSR